MARKHLGPAATVATHAVTVAALPWVSEMVCNSAALVDGYNDMVGGIWVEPGPSGSGIVLDSVGVRLADPTATIGGSGNLSVAIYRGSPTAAETTLVTTVTLAAGGHDTVAAVGTPLACAAGTVLRAKFSRGSTTVAGPIQVQFRGRYA